MPTRNASTLCTLDYNPSLHKRVGRNPKSGSYKSCLEKKRCVLADRRAGLRGGLGLTCDARTKPPTANVEEELAEDYGVTKTNRRRLSPTPNSIIRNYSRSKVDFSL